MASLAAHPGGAVRSATLPDAHASARGLAVGAGSAFAADGRSLRIDLGEDARLEATFARADPWPRRAFGALGPGPGDPRPEPVLAPVAAARLRERQRARRRPDDRPRRRGGLRREELGAGWDAAGLVVGPGPRLRPPRRLRRVRRRPRGHRAAARHGDRARRRPRRRRPHRRAPAAPAACHRGRPRLAPVGRRHRGRRPRLRRRSRTCSRCPCPHERRRLDDWAPQHLTGTLHLRVRRRGRTLYEGTSHLAGLERGRGHTCARGAAAAPAATSALPSGSLKKTKRPQGKSETSLTSIPRSVSSARAASASATTSCRPLTEPGARVGDALAQRDRAGRAGRRELHEAHLVAHRVVVVGVESGPYVEVLRAVDVGDGHRDQLELHVHAVTLSRRARRRGRAPRRRSAARRRR